MLHSKIVLPTMVCVLDSTIDFEEMHRHYCVQPAKGKSCSPLRSWKGNEQPGTVFLATQNARDHCHLRAVTSVLPTALRTLNPIPRVLDKHDQAFPKNRGFFFFFFSFHTPNMFLLSNLIYVFNLTVFGGGNTT